MSRSNNHTLNAAIIRVQELNAEGKANALIRAHMTIEGYSAKVISQAIKEAGCNQIGSGFTVAYYAFLAEKIRTDAEVLDYINGRNGYVETSDNTKKHESHYVNIAKLAQRIFVNCQDAINKANANAKTESRSHDDSPIGKRIKAAFDKIHQAMIDKDNGKEVKRSQFHPDKVSQLGDDELTALYSEFFKSF